MSQNQIRAIVKLQRRFRGFMHKSNFFKALRENQRTEHQNNFLRLRQSIVEHEESKRKTAKNVVKSLYRFIVS